MSNKKVIEKDSAKNSYFSNKKSTPSNSSTSRPGKKKTSIFAMEYYQDKVNYRQNYYTIRNFRDIRSYMRGEKTNMEFKMNQWYKHDNFTFLPKGQYFFTPMYWYRNNLCIYCPELTCLISSDYLGGMYNYMSNKPHNFNGSTLEFKARGEFVPLGGKIEKSLEEGHIYLKEKVDFNVLLSNYRVGYPRAYILSKPLKVKGKDVWKYEVTSNVCIGIGLDYPLGVIFTEEANYEYLLCPSDVINNLYQFVTRFGLGFKNLNKEGKEGTKLVKEDEEFSDDEENKKDKGKEKEKDNNNNQEKEEKKEEKEDKTENKPEVVDDDSSEEFESEDESEKEEEKDKEEKKESIESKEKNELKSSIPDNKKSLLDG